jgi:hypothetical protein
MILILLVAFFSFFQCISANQASSNQAERILNSVTYQSPSPSIIGKREWKELQLDRLVTILDRTKTSFGRWGLVQLLHPIADKKQLQKRKEIITFLVDNPEQMRIFQEQLEQVRRVEKSLLAYWDKEDQLSRSVEQFYFSSLGLHELNKSSIALNASTALEMFNSFKYLLTALALSGVAAEYSRWLYGDNKENFNVLRGIEAGFEIPLIQHSLSPVQVQVQDVPYTVKDYVKAFGGRGSWYDRYLVLSRGYSFKGISYVPEELKEISAGVGKLGGIIGATISTLFFDYQWGNAIFSVGKRIMSMNRDLNQLQVRVSDVAQCVKSIMNLRKVIASQGSEFKTYFDAENDDEVLDVFVKKLFRPRFLQNSGYLYSRGHVLTMHQDIRRIKKSLIPLLHSVALLDAYCSIAQLYKESQSEPVVFSFPEFVESHKPFMQYHDAWLPLLPYNAAITNDLALGGDQPGKIIITGPNGGGKSTVLKTYGVAEVLAQSWCIVPAQRAEQTLFASIRTGLSPQEDLEQGLSTFMAEKKAMTELLADIRTSNTQHPMLVLIDEPYKGTVDDESAKRIYQFGKDVAGFSQALVSIATHVKKPILLEHDTEGIFGNYQVKIREISPGIFERLFKIEKGPATWWFEDEDQRSRFIDWISTKSIVFN